MRYVNVSEEFVKGILKVNKLSEDLNESQESEAPEVESVDETQEELHACPLCESELESPISDEALQECVDSILLSLESTLMNEDEEADLDDGAQEKVDEEEEDK